MPRQTFFRIQTRTLCLTCYFYDNLCYYTGFHTNDFFGCNTLNLIGIKAARVAVNPQVPGSSPGRGAKKFKGLASANPFLFSAALKFVAVPLR